MYLTLLWIWAHHKIHWHVFMEFCLDGFILGEDILRWIIFWTLFIIINVPFLSVIYVVCTIVHKLNRLYSTKKALLIWIYFWRNLIEMILLNFTEIGLFPVESYWDEQMNGKNFILFYVDYCKFTGILSVIENDTGKLINQLNAL